MVETINEIFKNIKNASIFSHRSIHSAVRQLLRTVLQRLQNIVYIDGDSENSRKPNEVLMRRQRPCVGYYTITILEFISCLIQCVQKEPQLIKMLFCV